jgi:ribosomal protein S18 acetylase RimI-like enzyme
MFFTTGTVDANVQLGPFTPADLPGLTGFLNRAFAGHRHYEPITPEQFVERVTAQPAFDPDGLILARAGGEVVGGVHAVRPPVDLPCYQGIDARHHIAWLAVAPGARNRGLGTRLLTAAEDYLYYCPVYFAAETAPFYGIIERLWAPWYGSTERMAISAVHDKPLIDWLSLRGFAVVDAGDISLTAMLHTVERPVDPGLARRGLRCVPISERNPWQGEEPFYRLQRWSDNGRRAYHGLVIADGDHAVGNIVWYPLPDGLTAALAWLGIERQYRGLRFGSYLLDRALAGMASRGYLYVEAHVHTRKQPEALALFRHRSFQVLDYWVNLVKT